MTVHRLQRRVKHHLVGSRQTDTVLGDIVEDHLVVDRRDFQDTGSAPQGENASVLIHTAAAMELDRGIAHAGGRIRRLQFGHVGIHACIPPAVELFDAVVQQQAGRLRIRLGLCQGMLHCLVGTGGLAIKQGALVDVLDRLPQGQVSKSILP